MGTPVGHVVVGRVVGAAVPGPEAPQVPRAVILRQQLDEIVERLSVLSEEVAMKGDVLDGDAAQELLKKLQMDRALLVPLCGAYEEEGTSEDGLAKALMWLDACDHLIDVAEGHAGATV